MLYVSLCQRVRSGEMDLVTRHQMPGLILRCATNLLHRSLQSHNVMRVMYANEQVTGYRSWTRDRVENTENRALTGLSGGYIRYNESWFRLIRVQVERVWGLKEFGCEGLAADGDQLGDWFQRRSHQWWPSNGFRVEFHPIRSVWVSQKQKVV